MKAKLILENGMTFSGVAFGAIKDTVGEVVFNTGMTGYQEILTDPSYFGQIVTMTYPLIGNYGLNLEDMESKTPKVRGLVVRELCALSSNFRSEFELDDYLKNHNIMGLSGIDTRQLTKILRNSGTMKGIVTTHRLTPEQIAGRLEKFSNADAVSHVSVKKKYVREGKGIHVAVMDYGIKNNIIRNFIGRDCRLTVFPHNTASQEVLAADPDLIFLSNGPGDPEDLREEIAAIREMIGKKPIAGICLGHQLLALALGGKTAKLKFGHRGCNHPVKDLIDGRVTITSQNHGYYVSEIPDGSVVTHISLNDRTVEGLSYPNLSAMSVQYHPEASPGPVENSYLFDRFLKLV